MILFPAIDLKDGQCVRLYKGDMEQATVFSDNPGAQAAAFVAEGAEFLHIVDLNGAFAGHPVNGAAVDAILKSAKSVPVQLGGGIRSIETIAYWLERGVRRVILGTIALRAPEVVREAARLFPGQVAVGIDAKGGHVAVEGWAETSELRVLDLARKFEDAGVASIIYTDIDRDGTLTGVNVEATVSLAEQLTIPVIASGGVASLDDLRALVEAKRGRRGVVEGAISGRAIYDGRLDLRAAIAFLKEAR
ncbi:1-(5-phosphoribosyl)-5-[(5-phosphoribosylamino)methylideneamino]imidazole-4-carboxamide isomerase [Govanella unica]|uniref:1-(5-phosphoribosyl)-5-[(5-phosphoribosylamino)methylideneamino] imidazole-4-carboxamide isomerase n=1 Tax=Govanella unica TaxID=2975056 RepID=A0A9X3TZ17_9PROT|nr:1-(5-phosphoribosyl)-5-[(5-phosphoribosylamino)methylideneamino]imidazole-4-carboxamide isomerase [Govania unica]MDA5194601.1 1-(5-phosphoribosyl)-5-[(5-phosphoribosylamino)methylideneamino]imidazole-4-carboxamide isomerase [Govania unica]